MRNRENQFIYIGNAIATKQSNMQERSGIELDK